MDELSCHLYSSVLLTSIMRQYWILFFLGFGTFLMANAQVKEPSMRRFGCWGSFGPPVVSAQCPRNTVIQVTRAGLKVRPMGSSCTYEEGDCGCSFGEEGCNMPNVRNLCMGRASCRLDVTQQYINTARCQGFSDYMYIEFNCVAAPKKSVRDVCSVGTSQMRYGFLRSPNYPKVYPGNTQCVCSLSTSPYSTISLTVLDLQSDPSCQEDKLIVAYKGQKQQLCGTRNKANRKIQADTNKLSLTFDTGQKDHTGGFWLKYEAEPADSVKIRCKAIKKKTPKTNAITKPATKPTTTTTEATDMSARAMTVVTKPAKENKAPRWTKTPKQAKAKTKSPKQGKLPRWTKPTKPPRWTNPKLNKVTKKPEISRGRQATTRPKVYPKMAADIAQPRRMPMKPTKQSHDQRAAITRKRNNLPAAAKTNNPALPETRTPVPTWPSTPYPIFARTNTPKPTLPKPLLTRKPWWVQNAKTSPKTQTPKREQPLEGKADQWSPWWSPTSKKNFPAPETTSKIWWKKPTPTVKPWWKRTTTPTTTTEKPWWARTTISPSPKRKKVWWVPKTTTSKPTTSTNPSWWTKTTTQVGQTTVPPWLRPWWWFTITTQGATQQPRLVPTQAINQQRMAPTHSLQHNQIPAAPTHPPRQHVVQAARPQNVLPRAPSATPTKKQIYVESNHVKSDDGQQGAVTWMPPGQKPPPQPHPKPIRKPQPTHRYPTPRKHWPPQTRPPAMKPDTKKRIVRPPVDTPPSNRIKPHPQPSPNLHRKPPYPPRRSNIREVVLRLTPSTTANQARGKGHPPVIGRDQTGPGGIILLHNNHHMPYNQQIHTKTHAQGISAPAGKSRAGLDTEQEEPMTVTVIAVAVISSILLIVILGIVVRFIMNRRDHRHLMRQRHKKECVVRRNAKLQRLSSQANKSFA